MPLPQVAIVGRPNVGKSSLLNRLMGRRVSIVDPTPGVTRDRVTAVLEVDAPIETPRGTPTRFLELVDTGGYGVYVVEGNRYNDVGADLADLTPDIERQIRFARDEAALILFVTDAQVGPTPLDQSVARILREEGAGDRVIPVANKVDGDSWVAHGLEMSGLGLGEPICVSASNGYGDRELLDVLWNRLEEWEAVDPDDEPEMKLAIVGKRNAGKSTLINALAGCERVIVSEIAGTTRDSVDVRFEIDGRSMLAIDTAGVRQRRSFADDIEYYAYHRMLSAIRRADVCLLLVDATVEVSQVDKKLSQELQRQYKPTVIVVNKWDLVEDRLRPEEYLKYLTEQLRGIDFAPIVFMSAKEADGLKELVTMTFTLYEQASYREPTAKLNEIVADILSRRGPTSKLGTHAKLLFAVQVAVRPPTIVLVVNQPKLFRGRYERYLTNRLREELPFDEVPIRVLFKRRVRKELEDLLR